MQTPLKEMSFDRGPQELDFTCALRNRETLKGPRRDLAAVSGKRIVIAVEHRFLAEVLKNSLASIAIEVVLTKPAEVLNMIATLTPEMAIVDMPLLKLQRLLTVARSAANTKVIYLGTDTLPESAALSFRHGVSAYVLKQDGIQGLLSALRNVAVGRRYLSALISKTDVNLLLRERPNLRPTGSVSSRELEVLELLMNGLTMKEVASALNIKEGTVAFHKYRAMEKLRLNTTADLIKYGMLRGASNATLAFTHT